MSDNYVRVLITDLAHCRLVIICKSFKNSRGFITLTYNYAIALLRRRDHFCRRGASHCKAGDAHAPCVENKSTHRKFRRDGSEVRSPPHGRSCTVRLFPGMRRSYARNHRRRRGECTRETSAHTSQEFLFCREGSWLWSPARVRLSSQQTTICIG